MPAKLEEMKALFLTESAKNKNLPIGGGLWSTALYHPEDAPASPLTEWTFDHPIKGMPESAAPKLGKVSSLVSMEVDVPAGANGVLYAPLAFLAARALTGLGLVSSLAVVLAALTCGALAVAVEFTQLFFPARTVSQNDILARPSARG